MSASRAGRIEDETAESPGSAETLAFPAAPPPTDQLLAGPVGDRCANCDAPLARDQRYCLNCGERRGRSRFAAGSAPMPAGPVAVTTTTPAAPLPPRRGSAGMTLIAGVATLILAMGVGVLIGQNNTSSGTPARSSTPQITINGGGGSGATSASTGTASRATRHVKTVKVAKTEKARAAKAAQASKPTAAAIRKAANAAVGATGGSNTQKPTEQPGQACQAGTPGCTNGKFTGNFFGN